MTTQYDLRLGVQTDGAERKVVTLEQSLKRVGTEADRAATATARSATAAREYGTAATSSTRAANESTAAHGRNAAAQQGAARAARELGTESGRASTAMAQQSKTGSELIGTLRGLAAAYGVVQGLNMARDAVQTGLAWEAQTRALNTATGSAADGAKELAFLRAETSRLGLNLDGLTGTYGKFLAASKALSREDQRELFLGVAEASTALALSQEQSTGALNAFLQMASKGTVQAEELRGQLGERIPGAFDMAARAMGVSTIELNKMLERGEVLASDLLPKMAAEMRKTFGPEAAKNVDSLTAQMNRFANATHSAKVAFTEGFGEGLSAGLKGAKRELDGINDGLTTTGRLLGAIIIAEDKWLALLKKIASIPRIVGQAAANAASGGIVDQQAIDKMIADTGTYRGKIVEVSEAQRYRATTAKDAASAEEQFAAGVDKAWKAHLAALEAAQKRAEAERQLHDGIRDQTKELDVLYEALRKGREEYDLYSEAQGLGLEITDGLSKAERDLTKAYVAKKKALEDLKSLEEANRAANEAFLTAWEATAAERAEAGYASGAEIADQIAAGIADSGDQFEIPGQFDIDPGIAYARLLEANEKAAADAKSKAKEAADAWQGQLDGLADGIGATIGDAFAEMAMTGEFNFGRMLENMMSLFVQFLADQLSAWVANQIKMAAASYATGGGGGGGVNVGQAAGMFGGGGGGSMTAASATTLGIVAVFAAAIYAWHEDRQHEYERMTEAIRDIEDVFEGLSDTLGQYLPARSSGVDVRKDGDRYRARVGFDDGGAGYAYFDEYADAIGASILSSLREQLGQGDKWFDGPLAHLGEEAQKVIGSITDEIINMGQAGVEWLNEGLALARQLDQLGMTEMEKTLAELRREYENNIRKAAEYGLSLQKVGDLYRQQLGQLEQSLRDRIAQYLPGYDPIGAEFDRIREDNNALRAEYERQREALNEHIRQVLRTISNLEAGIGSGQGPAGGSGLRDAFNNVAETLRGMMDGAVGLSVDLARELMGQFNDLARAATESGGLTPEAARRIEAQREILADLMRQLELLGTGLSDEEIAAAEREARRRQNRGTRANEREALSEQFRDLVATHLPDLVRELVATQREIQRMSDEAARLGVDAALTADALRVMREQLAAQATDAYLSVAERMANLLGDEEALAELAQIRYDMELAQLGVQIAMLEESGLLQEEQVQRLWELYRRLPLTLPGDTGGDDTAPTGDGSGVLGALGIELGTMLERFEILERAARWVEMLTGATKDLDPELAAVRERIAGMSDEARAFVADQLFLQLGDQLVAFVERYGLEVEGMEEFKRQLEWVRFQLEIANMQVQLDMLVSLGLISEELELKIRGVLAAAGELDPNDPIFGGGPPIVPQAPTTTINDDRERFLERLNDTIREWMELPLGDLQREARGLRREYDELRTEATRLRIATTQLDAAWRVLVQNFVDDALEQFERLGESPLDRELADIRDRFADIRAALTELGAGQADFLRVAAAETAALDDFWRRATEGLRGFLAELEGADPRRSSQDRFESARDEFRRLAALAATGDLEALGQLEAAAREYRTEANAYLGQGVQSNQVLDEITSVLRALTETNPLTGNTLEGVRDDVQTGNNILRQIREALAPGSTDIPRPRVTGGLGNDHPAIVAATSGAQAALAARSGYQTPQISADAAATAQREQQRRDDEAKSREARQAARDAAALEQREREYSAMLEQNAILRQLLAAQLDAAGPAGGVKQ